MSKAFDRLTQLKEIILKEPLNFRMDEWHCGTAHCIAGWLDMLENNNDVDTLNCLTRAAHSIGIEGTHNSISESSFGNLVFTYRWPKVFYEMWIYADSREERAEIACMVIDDWMLTNGIKPD